MAPAPAMLLHAAVWNALHPNMHSLPGTPPIWRGRPVEMAGLGALDKVLQAFCT